MIVDKKAAEFPQDDVETKGWAGIDAGDSQGFFGGGVVLCTGD